MTVQVADSPQHLREGARSVGLRKLAHLLDTIEELAAGHAFHHQVELLGALVDIHQPRDIRVVHGQVDLGLASEHLGLVAGGAL